MLFTNIFVHSYAAIQDSVILPDVSIGRRCRVRRAVIDKGCRLPEDLVIGEDADADAKRFHRTEGGITVVTPDMLGQALHHGRS